MLGSGSDAHESLASLVQLSVQSQDAGLGMRPFIHCKKLPYLDISGLCLLLWLAYHTSGISDDWQGVHVDGLDLVLSVQPTFQDPPYSL